MGSFVSLPPVRACIFDMDGLLINTEDIITTSINTVLKKYGRPSIPTTLRAQIMGIPESTNGDAFHNWARLPSGSPREEYTRQIKKEMARRFPECEPLPGAEALLEQFSQAKVMTTERGEESLKLALASTSKTDTFKLKTSKSRTKALLDHFTPECRILGDDPRLYPGRGKPAPDIYLLALKMINDTSLEPGEDPIRPEECLVFEDSIIGVEAGRRAGMRVLWVPHPDLVDEYKEEKEHVLCGRTGTLNLEVKAPRNNGNVGQLGDGWSERISSLEHFDLEQFGLYVQS